MEQRLEVTRHIDADPGAVWRVITALDSAPSTLRGVTAVERLDGTGYEVGTRWRETRVMFGKSATEEMQVAEVVPERRTVVTAESGGTHYRTVFDLAPTEDGTELTVAFSGESGPMGAVATVAMTLFAPLAKRATRKALQQDLEDIAAAAEQVG